jgi:hypothetical protein
MHRGMSFTHAICDGTRQQLARSLPLPVLRCKEAKRQHMSSITCNAAAEDGDRRSALLRMTAAALLGGANLAGSTWQGRAAAASPLAPPIVRPELAPDQSAYPAADPRLRAAASLVQQALNAEDVQEEERKVATLMHFNQTISSALYCLQSVCDDVLSLCLKTERWVDFCRHCMYDAGCGLAS